MSELRIGIIGAGTISDCHINAYINNPETKVVAICDLNEKLVSEKAESYGIEKYYTDFNELLSDESIDAVSIVTPTFTHKNFVLEALKKGKHVLCEKPPARNYEEAEAIRIAAEKSGKVLMYAFVCRFFESIQYIKKLADDGKLGDIYYAEARRIARACAIKGWFVDKEKAGGGALIDGAIHELDAALYIMGYPEVESVKGYATDVNTNLPYEIKGQGEPWKSSDTNKYERTVESLAGGLVRFKNGAVINVKSSWVLNTFKEGRFIELNGTKGGAEFDDGKIRTLSIENNYFVENFPLIKNASIPFDAEIKHFTDCVLHGAECICTPYQGAQIMKIITAIYESAKTGKEIVF